MSHADTKHAHLKLMPILAHESLYIGVDIGKRKHVAGFVSTTLLQRYQRFDGCPAFPFEQSREGFRALVERMRTYTSLESCYALMEQTGHYHKALEQYLQELDLPVYIMHVQHRQTGMVKLESKPARHLTERA